MKNKAAARLNRAISKAILGMRPPESLTVSEWADKYRVISAGAAEPGPWRTSRTPYLREIMDAFTDPKVRHIVIVAASQIGKSELLNNIVGYIIHQDPDNILFVQPTVTDCKEYSPMRLAPMIRDCYVLRNKVVDPKGKEGGNTILQKTYPGGVLTLCGSTEAHSLASKPVRYLLGDERDRWAISAGKEGDPWELAITRQTTFFNAKAVEVSTPTIKGASTIAEAYAVGTRERWKSKCPHCGEYHEIQRDHIRYDDEITMIDRQKSHHIRNILYSCPGCGCSLTEQEIKRQPARWEAENPDAYEQGTRSFWLNAFVSPWAQWETIFLRYANAEDDPRKLQVIYNTCFGELWENRGDLPDEDILLERREEYPAELPDGVLVLTCGVDTQKDRLEFEIVGHGFEGETWGIQKGIIMGDPNDNTTWEALDDVINRVYRFKDGLGLKISMTFVDEGGLTTQAVRLQCRARIGRQVFCIKGFDGLDRPYTSAPKDIKIVINKRYLGTCKQYQLGVDSGKQMIMSHLEVKDPGPKYCHFPRRDDYGPAYFHGLLSEHLICRDNKKWAWVKLPGHERNEPLDCRNYALAAFDALPANLEAIDQRLKEARGERKKQAEARTLPAGKPTARRKGAGMTINEYFNEW